MDVFVHDFNRKQVKNLSKAIESGNLDKVMTCITNQSGRISEGMQNYHLSEAAELGHLEIVKYFVSIGFAYDKYLNSNIRFDRSDILRYLLSICPNDKIRSSGILDESAAKVAIAIANSVQHQKKLNPNYVKNISHFKPYLKMHAYIISMFSKRDHLKFLKNEILPHEKMFENLFYVRLISISVLNKTQRNLHKKNNILKKVLKPKSLGMQMTLFD
jgi:hypothetical protein